jgi:hypothetical protein
MCQLAYVWLQGYWRLLLRIAQVGYHFEGGTQQLTIQAKADFRGTVPTRGVRLDPVNQGSDYIACFAIWLRICALALTMKLATRRGIGITLKIKYTWLGHGTTPADHQRTIPS